MNEFTHLLPRTASTTEKNTEQAITRPIVFNFNDLYHVETCPAKFLPWLAWAMSVDEWNPDWPDDIKRNVIRESFAIHQHKGTLAAVKRAIETLNHEIQITEWFNNAGDPYTFTMDLIADSNKTANDYIAIKRMVNAAKNVRSTYQLYLKQQYQSPLVVAPVFNYQRYIKIGARLPPPIANFSYVIEDGTSNTFLFTDISTGGVSSWQWDFGDGQTSTAQNPIHEYTSLGTYSVTLTVSNNVGESSSYSQQVSTLIDNSPTADFIVSPAATFENPAAVNALLNFTSSSTDDYGIENYVFDFNDGATANSNNVNHRFNAEGRYVVSLAVTDGVSQTDTIEKLVCIYNGNKGGWIDFRNANYPVAWLDTSVNATAASHSDYRPNHNQGILYRVTGGTAYAPFFDASGLNVKRGESNTLWSNGLFLTDWAYDQSATAKTTSFIIEANTVFSIGLLDVSSKPVDKDYIYFTSRASASIGNDVLTPGVFGNAVYNRVLKEGFASNQSQWSYPSNILSPTNFYRVVIHNDGLAGQLVEVYALPNLDYQQWDNPCAPLVSIVINDANPTNLRSVGNLIPYLVWSPRSDNGDSPDYVLARIVAIKQESLYE